MKLHKFLGNFSTCNAYLLEDGKRGILIDAPLSSLDIVEKIKSLNITLDSIYLTHSHFDHVLGLNDLVSSFPDVKIYIGKDELDMFENNGKKIKDLYYRFYRENLNVDIPLPKFIINNNDKLDFNLVAIHTPGHTVGGFTFFSERENIVFTGDTLFYESIGRTDIGGDDVDITESLNKILSLPKDAIVYPGHGESTTILHEIENNPFI